MSGDGTDLSARLDLEPGDPTAVLLLAPGLSEHEDPACIDLLTVINPNQQNVLSFTCTQSPTARLQAWQTHTDETIPAAATIVSVGDQSRSAGSMSSRASQSGALSIETVGSAGDLTKLGIVLTDQLREWAENDYQTVVCFHSLTTVLQYVELDRLFQFLHVALQRLRAADAIAHFHLDPSAHDEKTVNTLGQLFDAAVEITDHGDQTIKQR